MNILKNRKVLSLLILLALSVSILTPQVARAETSNTNATISFEGGLLKLITAPNLNFGSGHTIKSVDTTYPLEAVSAEAADPIHVSDLTGTGAGWDLSVSLSSFKDGGTNLSLGGAYITIEGQDIVGVNGNTAPAPAAQDPVRITSDETPVSLIKAGPGTGMADWQSKLTPENTSLTVLSGRVTTGTHTAIVSWTLGTAP